MRRLALAGLVGAALALALGFGSGGFTGKLYQDPLSFVIASPDDELVYEFTKASALQSITSIWCIVDPEDSSESAVLDFQECDATCDNCVTIDGPKTCTNTGLTDSNIASPTIEQGNCLRVVGGTITTVNGVLRATFVLGRRL